MDETVRLLDPQKRIESLLQCGEPLSGDDLRAIVGLLSKSDIKRLINSYPKAFHCFAFFETPFSRSWPDKILAVLENIAIERLKKEAGFKEQISDDLLFRIVLEWTRSFNWFSKRSFCSPQNRVVRLALERIKKDLKTSGEPRTKALTRLENFPIELIKEVVTTDNFILEKKETNYLKINAVWAEHTTPEFQVLLNAKKVDAFTQKINTVDDITEIEKLMRQLISRINTSFFKDKYEQMLEACFIRVMKLTSPREAMKLDYQVVIESLRIFDGYFFSRSRRRFFEKPGQDGYNMLASFRRTTPIFNAFPKLRALLPSYTLPEISQFDDSRLEKEIKSGNLDIQKILFDVGFDENFDYENLVERLVLQYGASLEWMDTNYTYNDESRFPCWATNDFSQLNFLLFALIRKSGKKHLKHWDFYVKCKSSDFNAVLVGIIDSCIHCFATPNFFTRAKYGFFDPLLEPVAEILRDPTVIVTQEMLDKFDILEGVKSEYSNFEKIKKMLSDKFEEQKFRTATKDKGERGADVNNNNNHDQSLERLKEVLENEYYFVDVNPLVQAVGERIKELENWKRLYLHELTSETRQMLPEDRNIGQNMETGKVVRNGYLKQLRDKKNDEDVNLLIRKAGSAVKTLTPDEVQQLRFFQLDKDVQIFLSKHFNANLVETVAAHESNSPVHSAGAAASVDPQMLAQDQFVAPGF